MSWFKRDDVVVDLLRSTMDRLDAIQKSDRDRIKELTNQVLEMKRDGFQYQPLVDRREEALPNMDERILAAIRSRAGEGTKLENELADFAQSLSITGVETEDIVDRILSGGLDD